MTVLTFRLKVMQEISFLISLLRELNSIAPCTENDFPPASVLTFGITKRELLLRVFIPWLKQSKFT